MATTFPLQPRILVTGATGQLGRNVIDLLLQRVPAASIVAGVRDVAKAADMAARGVAIRVVDYDKPATLETAFVGIERVLLISSNAVGQRVRQHIAAIDAAKLARVKLMAYTSVLRADVSEWGLAAEHRASEAALAASGIPHVLLRNSWYLENFAARATSGLISGELLTCAGAAQLTAASRDDYAGAAAVVLSAADDYVGQTLELSGSEGFQMAEVAELMNRIVGRPISLRNLPPAEYEAVLLQNGVPEFVAKIFVNSDASAGAGWLFDDSRTLERLIGRRPRSLEDVLRLALNGA